VSNQTTCDQIDGARLPLNRLGEVVHRTVEWEYVATIDPNTPAFPPNPITIRFARFDKQAVATSHLADDLGIIPQFGCSGNDNHLLTCLSWVGSGHGFWSELGASREFDITNPSRYSFLGAGLEDNLW
jgi:hypothetical protein